MDVYHGSTEGPDEYTSIVRREQDGRLPRSSVCHVFKEKDYDKEAEVSFYHSGNKLLTGRGVFRLCGCLFNRQSMVVEYAWLVLR